MDFEIKRKLNNELKKKKFPDIDNISKETSNGLANPGGADPLTLWLVKIFVVDFSTKVALGGGIIATIWAGNADSAANNLAEY